MELKEYSTPIKQVIVVRKDLKNSKGEKVHTGKLISSGAHASLKVFIDRGEIFNDAEGDFIQIPLTASMKYWLLNKFTKITLSVKSEEELLDIYEKAKKADIPCTLITDAGLTEFDGKETNTAVAIGPEKAELIDPITKHLPLF
jgi:PTH2 family peptidyl-tRNA hydrolase